MKSNTGYSGTPLAKKLGIRYGFRIRIVNAPEYYDELFTDMPDHVIYDDRKGRCDLIHYFTKEASQLKNDIDKLRNAIVPNGMIWISWPKKSSRIASDITEDTIRDLAITHGLVDVKVCSVNEIWSGLKLVIPLNQRIKTS